MRLSTRISVRGPVVDGRGPAIVQRNLDALVTELVMFLEREVKARTPQGVYGAQGGLLASIQGEVIAKGSPLIKGIIGSPHKYAEVVEEGRRPGQAWPPQGSLLRWIEVKMGITGTEARQVEFLIRRKIGKLGTDGAWMFYNAVGENWGRLRAIGARHGFDLARELNG